MPLNLMNEFLNPLQYDPITYPFVNERILVQAQYDFVVYLLVKLSLV